MGMLDQVTTGKLAGPRKVLIYGTAGIGKSTFAADAPNPIFIQTEAGSDDLEVARFPLAVNASMAWKAAREVQFAEHDYRTVVVDSADWLEHLVERGVVAKENNKKVETAQDIAYGKGWPKVAAGMRKFLDILDGIHARGMHVIVIAHADVVEFKNPEGDAFDRYQPRLNKKCWPVLVEWATEALFATYKVHVRTEDAGFNKKRGVGVGGTDRIVRTEERPFAIAKNRLGLPPEMPLSWAEFAEHIPDFPPPTRRDSLTQEPPPEKN